MRLINAVEAATEIKHATAGRDFTPFFFVVGSGISTPVVPMAEEIARICQEKIKIEGRQVRFPNGSPMENYSFWFQEAFRQPADRPLFLKELIENKPVSRANWRMAHLLSGSRIANVVVTPNFDDMLSRALTLLGSPHVSCDHPSTASRIDPESSGIQILHVHGTYQFYDCCNLSNEIEDRSNTSSMTSALNTLLHRRSPIILGYSGWEDDIIMRALKRRMVGMRMPRQVYWFCYSRKNIDHLPQWLRDHLDICFVVPQDFSLGTIEVKRPVLPQTEESISAEQAPKNLSAQEVLDTIIHQCEIPAPQLTCDPLGFFASRLRLLIIEEDSESDDPYFLRDVVDRIERARAHETQNTADIEKQVDNILNSLRNSNYDNALAIINSLDTTTLRLEQIESLSEAFWTATRDINLPEIELPFYKKVQTLMEEWVRRNDIVQNSPTEVRV